MKIYEIVGYIRLYICAERKVTCSFADIFRPCFVSFDIVAKTLYTPFIFWCVKKKVIEKYSGVLVCKMNRENQWAVPPQIPDEQAMADLLQLAVKPEFEQKLLKYLRQAEQDPRSLTPEDSRFVRSMLVCRLQRLYAFENWILRNMTVQGLFQASRFKEGLVLSVQSSDKGIINVILDSDMHGFLCSYVRYVRATLPGDDAPSSAFVFAANNGSVCNGLKMFAQRFAKLQDLPHYTTTQIRKVWENAARQTQDFDVMGPINAFLSRTNSQRASGANIVDQDNKSIYSQWLAMRSLREQVCSNCGPVPAEDMMTADSPQKSVDTINIRKMLKNDPSATPEQVIQAYGEDYGRILDKAFVKGIKRRVSCGDQEQTVRGWLKTQPLRPTRATIRQYINMHNLGYLSTPRAAVRIQGWWAKPPCPLGDRREEEKRKKEQNAEKSRFIQQCLTSVLWPGLAEFKNLSDRGRGLVTTQLFERGQVVCHYNGNILSGVDATECLRRCKEDQSINTNYLMEFAYQGKKHVVDGLEEDGSQGRLINHSSKHPNIMRSPRMIEGRLYMLFVAKIKIHSGAELFYDYGQRSAGGVRPFWLDEKFCPCIKCKYSRR